MAALLTKIVPAFSIFNLYAIEKLVSRVTAFSLFAILVRAILAS